MKLVTFERNGKAQIGCLQRSGEVLVFEEACRAHGSDSIKYFASMLALIEAGDAGLQAAYRLAERPPDEAVVALDSVKLLAPIPRPPRLRSMSSYPSHLAQAQEGRARIIAATAENPEMAFKAAREKFVQRPPPGYYETPVYWIMDPFCIGNPDDEVVWPEYSDWIDYELEIVAVIAKAGRDIQKEDAENYIFGYTLMNDLSARDEQARAAATSLSITAKGKDFERSCPMGPCIVTRDEIDVYKLGATLRVNGEVWAVGSTEKPQWTFSDCISYASRSAPLVPGEMISSATVANCSGLEQARKGGIGDVVELDVPGIGVLRNKIVRAGRP